MSSDLQSVKRQARSYWEAVDGAGLDQLSTVCLAHLDDRFVWQGPAPYTVLQGPDALAQEYLIPLKRAIPDLARQTHIFMAGHSNGHKDGEGDGAI